jgi:hypothetical protein
VEVNVIFFASLEMWKEEGGNGYIFSLFKKYICSVWMDDATDGWMESFISSMTSFTI